MLNQAAAESAADQCQPECSARCLSDELMAYSLFNSSAASNYLASFKPAKPVDGFDDVLSTSATDNITRMQELDYSGRIGLAKQALVELNAKLQNDALLDYYDRRDDKTMKIEKRKR